MAIADEIQRIKTNIANAYTELENKGATIPSDKNSNNLASTITTITGSGSGGGGDASINGKIEQKTIASGNVAKGDFVVATEQTLISMSNEETETSCESTITNIENILDNDEETYGVINGAGNYPSTTNFVCRIPTCDKLGISEDSTILDIGVEIKHKNPTTKNFSSLGLWIGKFKDDTPIAIGTFISLLYKSLTKEYKSLLVESLNVENNTKASNINKYGIRLYFNNDGVASSTKLELYYIKWIIKYVDKGKVKTATATSDEIVGVANSDGIEGDTIDVYVPNVVEEGVSYMNRMIEMNEQLQEKATAYDILTGEVE